MVFEYMPNELAHEDNSLILFMSCLIYKGKALIRYIILRGADLMTC